MDVWINVTIEKMTPQRYQKLAFSNMAAKRFSIWPCQITRSTRNLAVIGVTRYQKLDFSNMAAKRFSIWPCQITRSHDQPEAWLWLVSHDFSPDPRWRRRFSSEVSREVLVNETTGYLKQNGQKVILSRIRTDERTHNYIENKPQQ